MAAWVDLKRTLQIGGAPRVWYKELCRIVCAVSDIDNDSTTSGESDENGTGNVSHNTDASDAEEEQSISTNLNDNNAIHMATQWQTTDSDTEDEPLEDPRKKRRAALAALQSSVGLPNVVSSLISYLPLPKLPSIPAAITSLYSRSALSPTTSLPSLSVSGSSSQSTSLCESNVTNSLTISVTATSNSVPVPTTDSTKDTAMTQLTAQCASLLEEGQQAYSTTTRNIMEELSQKVAKEHQKYLVTKKRYDKHANSGDISPAALTEATNFIKGQRDDALLRMKNEAQRFIDRATANNASRLREIEVFREQQQQWIQDAFA
ncbi:hypothetical protein BGZ46_010618, partial [Entomortierella lignicola]